MVLRHVLNQDEDFSLLTSTEPPAENATDTSEIDNKVMMLHRF